MKLLRACAAVLLPLAIASAVHGQTTNSIPDQVLADATAGANEIAGTSVKTKTGGLNTDKLTVSTSGAPDRLAGTMVDDIHPPDEDDVAYIILINEDGLEQLIPGIWKDPDLLKRILKLILAHEFRHVPTGQGGNGHSAEGIECGHLHDYQDDHDDICGEIADVLADEDLTAERKCIIVAALCKYHKKIEEYGNTDDAAAAAPNCIPPVVLTDGKVVPPCPTCEISEECPIHHTDYGSI